MAKKKTIYGPDVHPNAGTLVTIRLVNTNTGAESDKAGMWNGTHWVLVNRRTGEHVQILQNFKVVGWRV